MSYHHHCSYAPRCVIMLNKIVFLLKSFQFFVPFTFELDAQTSELQFQETSSTLLMDGKVGYFYTGKKRSSFFHLIKGERQGIHPAEVKCYPQNPNCCFGQRDGMPYGASSQLPTATWAVWDVYDFHPPPFLCVCQKPQLKLCDCLICSSTLVS